MKAQFIMMVVAVSLFAVVGTVKAQPYHTTSISMDGSINNTTFTMDGSTVYSGSNPPSQCADTWTFSNQPPDFHPYLMLCGKHCQSHHAISPAVNLVAVSGGDFQAQYTMIYRDPLGNVIGQLSIDGNFTETSDSTSTFVVTCSGTYTGPTDIVNLSGITKSLHQVSGGHITESYHTDFTTSTGEILTRDATVDYTYGGPGMLPGDEVQLITVESIGWDPEMQILTMTGTGVYLMVTAVPTVSEWGLIIFGVVLLGFITWVFLKRRKVIGVRV